MHFNLKTTWILFCLFLASSTSYGQVQIKEIQDIDQKSLLSQIDTVIFIKGKNMGSTIFRVNNGSGSAHLPESDEVSYSFLISVSEYDENPESKLFSVGPFIYPKLSNNIDMGENYSLQISYDGANMQRKKNRLIITLDSVQLK
jgi:hypothetical protein